MTSIKKAASLILALLVVLTFSFTTVPAFAADEGDATTTTATTYKLTLNNTTVGHTYSVYQIYTGTISGEAGSYVLSDVKYGKNYGTEGTAVPETELTELKGKTGDQALADITPTGNAFKTVDSTATTTTIDGLPAGYYLVVETTAAADVPDEETMTKSILQVVGDTNVDIKSGTTTSDKKVKDINDTTGETSDWKDSADWDIGDKVPFKLTATVASDYANYTKGYTLTFHDKEGAGLTFDASSVKVYIGADSTNPIDAKNYTVTTEGLTDGCTFEVKFENLKKITSVAAGTVIRVEYESTLNEHAVIGSTGNPNESHITYTNNPNDTQHGDKGKTPEDKVIVFTYKLTADKIDADTKAALKGAGFTLYKKGPAAEGSTEPTWTKIGEEVTGPEMTEFSWTGLDDGDYKLVETKTPDGYNTMADLEFTISAEHSDGDTPALTSLTGGNKFTGELTKGELKGNIENKKGSTLPSTGGIGTVLFYVGGIALIAGAAALLIRRKHSDQE